MSRNEERKFVYKGLELWKALCCVFSRSLYASGTLQDLEVCKAFGSCCGLKDALLQKCAISKTVYGLSSAHSCSHSGSYWTQFLQPTKDTGAYMMLGKSVENVAVFFLYEFTQLRHQPIIRSSAGHWGFKGKWEKELITHQTLTSTKMAM